MLWVIQSTSGQELHIIGGHGLQHIHGAPHRLSLAAFLTAQSLVAQQRGSQIHLAAGHAEDTVVHHDHGDGNITDGSIAGLSQTDHVGAAVTSMDIHGLVGADPLHAGGHRSAAAMGSRNELIVHSVLAPERAGNIHRSKHTVLQAQLFNALSDQALHNAVAAARTPAGSRNDGFRFLKSSHLSTPPQDRHRPP